VQIPLNPVDFTSGGAAFKSIRLSCTNLDAFAQAPSEIPREKTINQA
jgi:hypothetical protein